jgi:hypothetical protein
MLTFSQFISEDYRMEHKAPGPDFGSPMHDVTSQGTYPEDFYSSKGREYYGDAIPEDRESHSKIVSVRNKPEAKVNIYRAVPTDHENAEINKGDWVSASLSYAKKHGQHLHDKNYRIIKKSVPARHLYTDGNSIHEFGYHPD